MTSEDYVFKSAWKKRLAGFVDLAGGALFRLTYKAHPQKSRPLSKILLIRLDHLGDLILTRPAIRLLSEQFPEIRIDWLVPAESRPLLGTDPLVETLIPFENHWYRRKAGFWRTSREFFTLIRKIKSAGYDAAVDFRGDIRSILLMFLAGIPRRIGYGITGGGFLLTDCVTYDRSLHQVELNVKLLETLGISGKPEHLPLRVHPDLFSPLVPRTSPEVKRVIIHPGAGYPSKVWPAENFEALIESLCVMRNLEIVVIGTQNEQRLTPMEKIFNRQVPSVKDLRGKIELKDLPALMQNAELFIGGDSGPAHIAAAQGIMILSLFSGANDEKIWKPWTPNLHLISKKVPCSPCGLSVCPLPDHPCMSGIGVEEVIKTARRLLEGKPV